MGATVVLFGLAGCPDDGMFAGTDTQVDDSPVCGNASSDLFTGLELCVRGGMGSDCALSCIDTLCAGEEITGDDCKTCLMGAVDCNPQYGLSVQAAPHEPIRCGLLI